MAKRIFLLLVLGSFLYVTSSLLLPLTMGAVLAALVYPLFTTLEKKRWSPFPASGLLTLGVTLLFVIPVTLLFFFVAKTGLQTFQAWKDTPRTPVPGGAMGVMESFLDIPWIHNLLEKATVWFPLQRQELIDGVQELIRTTGLKVADLMTAFLAKIPGAFLATAVMMVGMYFFLVEGKSLIRFLKRNSFFTPSQTDTLFHWLGSVCRSVILASLVAGASQALVEMIFCAALGVPNTAMVGGLVFVGSFIPLIGSAPATIGVAIHQFSVGNATAGVILAVASLIVMVMDNFIRPLFLKGSANLHPLLAFVAAFGGLQTMGMLGVFLGPILAALCVATLQIVFEEEGSAARR